MLFNSVIFIVLVIVFIFNTITINAFRITKIKTSLFPNNKDLNNKYEFEFEEDINNYNTSPIQYFEYCIDAPAYTIISHEHTKLLNLLEQIKKHKINYVYINANCFTHKELIEICNFYYIKTGKILENDPLYLYKDALVFLEDKEFIGGIFEMYQVIFKSH